MSHFAHVSNGIVDDVIVAEQEFINSGAIGEPSEWIKTSYNTRGGVHFDPETGEPDGGFPLRKNYAIIGGLYDPMRDAFIPPKPFNSWILNEDTCLWEAPIPYPQYGKFYAWDEEATNWLPIEISE